MSFKGSNLKDIKTTDSLSLTTFVPFKGSNLKDNKTTDSLRLTTFMPKKVVTFSSSGNHLTQDNSITVRKSSAYLIQCQLLQNKMMRCRSFQINLQFMSMMHTNIYNHYYYYTNITFIIIIITSIM